MSYHHQLEILNYNHNVVALPKGNTIIVTDNNAYTSIIIPQPVTYNIQVNSYSNTFNIRYS